jgi:Mrp family chromosome partitioning ATPase
MSFLLSYLAQRFDVLIIDSPPILLTGDALLLAPQADGVVLVVRAGQASRELIKKSIEQVHRAQAYLVGVALNDVDLKRSGYYKGYYKYSSYYYGDNE